MKRREFLRRAGSVERRRLAGRLHPARNAQPPHPRMPRRWRLGQPTRSPRQRPRSRRSTAEPALAATVAATATVVAAATTTLPTDLGHFYFRAARRPRAGWARSRWLKATDRAEACSVLALFGSRILRGPQRAAQAELQPTGASPGSTHPDVLRTLVIWLREQRPTSPWATAAAPGNAAGDATPRRVRPGRRTGVQYRRVRRTGRGRLDRHPGAGRPLGCLRSAQAADRRGRRSSRPAT